MTVEIIGTLGAIQKPHSVRTSGLRQDTPQLTETTHMLKPRSAYEASMSGVERIGALAPVVSELERLARPNRCRMRRALRGGETSL